MRSEVFLFCFIFCFIKAFAQTNELKIKVYDSAHLPIEEVVFIDMATAKELKTNNQGEIVIRGDSTSTYLLFKEDYSSKQYSWKELNENKRVILAKENQTLSELFIYASPTKNDASTIRYKIKEQLLGENPTVFHIIETLPLFFVQGEKIMYKGREVTVIVNGKKHLGKIENIDPKNIRSIEVIPYGHAAYGATGEPVLNIVLKENLFNYFREDLMMGYNLNKEDYVLNANSFFKKDRVTLSLPIRSGESFFDSHSSTSSNSIKINSSKDKTISSALTVQPEISIKLTDKSSISSSLFFYTPKNQTTRDYNIPPQETINKYKQHMKYLNTGSLFSFNTILNDSTALDLSFLYTYNEYRNNGDYMDNRWNNILYDNALSFDAILKRTKRKFLTFPIRYDIYYSYYQSEIKNRNQNNVTNRRSKLSFTTTLTVTNSLSLTTDLSYNLLNKDDGIVLHNSTVAYTKKTYSIYLNYYNDYHLISVYDVNKQNSVDDNLNTTIDNYAIQKSNSYHSSLEFNYMPKSGIEVFVRGKLNIHHKAPVAYLVKSKEDEFRKTIVNAGKNKSYVFELGGFFEINDHFIIQTLFTYNRSQFKLVDYTTDKDVIAYDFYAKYRFKEGYSIKLASSYANFDLFTPLESNQIKYPFVSLTIEKEFINNLKIALVVNNPFIKAKEVYTSYYSANYNSIQLIDTRFKSKEINNYSSLYLSLSYTLGNSQLRNKRDVPIQATY
ncbi:hypothetical protein ACPDHL_12905 [Myroides sp. C15-4]|uniref:hypothetical protein n=1 Tax=Myroides sp. C15-4 TaxID=3400532 RepID=UPI003D2F6AC1